VKISCFILCAFHLDLNIKVSKSQILNKHNWRVSL